MVFAVASRATMFGVIHSPLASGALFWPWTPVAPVGMALRLAGTYGVLATFCWLAERRAVRAARESGC